MHMFNELFELIDFYFFVAYPAISAYVSNYADADKQGLVQGIVTGIRGLCNGLGPCAFGLVFNLFDVDLTSENSQPSHPSPSLAGTNLNNLHHAVAIPPTSLFPRTNNSLSSHLYGLLNSTILHHRPSPMENLIPGPPFLFGALLVLLAILVMAFIPELVQYPPNSPNYGDHSSFSSAGPFASSKNRTSVMSPSRISSRSSTNSNYYYKSMHLPSSLTDDTDCSNPSDNVKMVATHQVQHHKHSSPRKVLLTYSESENDKEELTSSDEDHAIFDQTLQQRPKSQSTATIGVTSQGTKHAPSSRVSQAFASSSLNQSSVEIRPSHHPKHHSHQLLSTTSSAKAFSSSSPTLTRLTDQDTYHLDQNDDDEGDHSLAEPLNSHHRSHLYKPLLQAVES